MAFRSQPGKEMVLTGSDIQPVRLFCFMVVSPHFFTDRGGLSAMCFLFPRAK
jgi:hypothetical protein